MSHCGTQGLFSPPSNPLLSPEGHETGHQASLSLSPPSLKTHGPLPHNRSQGSPKADEGPGDLGPSLRLTFMAEAGWARGGGGGGRQCGFLGRLLLLHPGILRRLQGAGRHRAAATARGARFRAAASAVARVTARVQGGNGLLKRRRNQCRV